MSVCKFVRLIDNRNKVDKSLDLSIHNEMSGEQACFYVEFIMVLSLKFDFKIINHLYGRLS
ncbi:MAG: hypothetical protein H0W19_07060 [Nitrosopumilus sp.]|nr:hypothetical protein [Nitrosopumilus sp.]